TGAWRTQRQVPQGGSAGCPGGLFPDGPVRGAVHERTQPPSGGVGVHRRGRTWGTAFGRRPELGARPRGGGRSRCGTTNAFATGADPGRGGCGTAPEDP